MSDDTTQRQQRIFGGYRLLDTVHDSPSAELMLASHEGLAAGKRYLVKRYRSREPGLIHGVSRRCARLRALQHRCLPPLLDHGTASNSMYIAREYLRGVDLAQVVRWLARRGLALPLEQLSSVVIEVLDALDMIHLATTRGGVPRLTHGDVSPEHIFLGLSGQPYILGFETPRGDSPGRSSVASLDVTVPAAILYGHLRATHLGQEDDARRGLHRQRLVDALRPIVRRGLGLDAQRSFRSPLDLADAIRGCLDYAGFEPRLQALVPTVEAIASGHPIGDTSSLSVMPTRRRPLESPLLSPALDVGVPDGATVTAPPLGVKSAAPRPRPRIPAPIDFGGQDDRLAHPLPAFEVGAGDEALAAEDAQQLGSALADILDPFDDRSAEYDLSDLSDPFGEQARAVTAAVARDQTRATQRIGHVLVDLGFVRYSDIREALDQQGRGVRLGEHLVRRGRISEMQLVQALGRLYDLKVLTGAEVAALVPDATVVAALPSTFVAAHRIVPLAVDSSRSCAHILLVDPTRRAALTEAKVLLEVQELDCALCQRDAIDALILRLYPAGVHTEVSSAKATILLVDADDARRRDCANRLRAERFVIEDVASAVRARRVLDSAMPSAVVSCLDDRQQNLDIVRRYRARIGPGEGYAGLAGDEDVEILQQVEALEADLLVLPLRVDYLVAKIRRVLAARQAPLGGQDPAPGVAGRLENMNLLELVQTLRLRRRTVRIELTTEQGAGELTLVAGNIVDAQFCQRRGDEAFLALCSVDNGEFVVREVVETDVRRSVFESTERLFIEAARRSWKMCTTDA